MPIIISDEVRMAIIEEDTVGLTPSTPVFSIMRLNSESLTQTSNSVTSAELSSARGVTDSIFAGASVGGSVESYFQFNADAIDLMCAVIGATPMGAGDPASGEATVTPGDLLTGYTFERTIPNNTSVTDGFSYMRYAGVTPTSFTVGYAPQEPLTFSCALLGGTLTLDEDTSTSEDGEIIGATYDAPVPTVENAPPMRSDGVSLTWGGGGASTSLNNGTCTALSITVDSQNREVSEIGTLATESALGKIMISITATYLFRDNEPAESQLDQDDLTLVVTMVDSLSSPNEIEFEFDRVRVVQATTVTPGTGSDVVVEMECEALTDDTGDQIEIKRDRA